MRNWEEALIPKTANVMQAIEIIDKSSIQIGLVVGSKRKLLGVITDGDIRRAILKGISMLDSVSNIMVTNFIYASDKDDIDELLSLMQREDIRQIPILNANSQIVGLKVLMDFVRPTFHKNPVVLMAGGMGTGLRPLTNERPKPLLSVGGKPVLETILRNFVEQGFNNIIISLNYKGKLIEEYFGNGDKFGAKIDYIHEKEPLGTAGSLRLIHIKETKDPLIVMNGDLLTKVNFIQLLNFHSEYRSTATMCVRNYEFQVPFGVASIHDNQLLSLDEKPTQRLFINAGIYVLEYDILNLIPKNKLFNMTDLFQVLLSNNYKTTAFPIHEYWIDIGQMHDLERANGEFTEYFNACS